MPDTPVKQEEKRPTDKDEQKAGCSNDGPTVIDQTPIREIARLPNTGVHGMRDLLNDNPTNTTAANDPPSTDSRKRKAPPPTTPDQLGKRSNHLNLAKVFSLFIN